MTTARCSPGGSAFAYVVMALTPLFFSTNLVFGRSVAGINVFASLLAFSGYQYGVRHLGAPMTGMFMYMLPVYGVGLSVIFLG